MWPDQVSNPGPIGLEADALPTTLSGPASVIAASESAWSNRKDKTVYMHAKHDTHRDNAPPPMVTCSGTPVSFSTHDWSNNYNNGYKPLLIVSTIWTAVRQTWRQDVHQLDSFPLITPRNIVISNGRKILH